jgi:ribosome recycling factor
MKSVILVENDIQTLKKPLEEEMHKPIEHLVREMAKIRAGRAKVAMIEDISVLVQGQKRSLKSVATLAAPEARLLTIQPWDVSLIPDIEKAIMSSDLGVTPANDGRTVRIQLPEVSKERRSELVKVLDKRLEECRVGIRNVRKEFQNTIRDSKKDKSISENFFNRLSDVLEEATGVFIKKAEEMAKKREQEITAI